MNYHKQQKKSLKKEIQKIHVIKTFRVFITCYLIALAGINTSNAQTIKKGVLDLQKSNILNENVVDLSGEWQFEYGRHL